MRSTRPIDLPHAPHGQASVNQGVAIFAHLQSRNTLLVYLGGAYRESLEDHFSLYIFCYSLPLHIRDFHVRYSRTPPFYWERTVSVCIMTLYSVFVLCVFSPPLSFYSSCILLAYFSSVSMHAPLCATSSLVIRLEGPIYLAEHVYLEGSICSEGSQFVLVLSFF